MEQKSTLLSEIQVTADHIPIEITKDTITYNADAFQTQPNADVEDLLKKLPGIEVAPDGTIKAQGEDVQRVTVDGKEFFGTDPQMATKNLPARAVKKVKVFDKKSDASEFTGVDDGERIKTIDLQLKEEFKQGLFGKVEGGYGSDERYMGNATINKFDKTTQLSFLGQLNNINEQGFSFNDAMTFSGGMRGLSRGGEFRMSSDIPFNQGTSSGLAKTGAAGLNFNWEPNKKFNIRSSYFYNDVNRSILQQVFRQNLFDNPFNTEEDSEETSHNRSHRMTLDSEVKPDSTQQFEVSLRFSVADAEGIAQSQLQNSLPSGPLENASATVEDNQNENISLSATALYMKRLKKAGRSFNLSTTLTEGDQQNESALDAITEYFLTGETELLDQFAFNTNDNTQWQGQFAFIEPLKKRKFLEFNYNFSQSTTDYNKVVSDLTPQEPVVVPGLSNSYTSIFQYHRPGVAFRYNGTIHTINTALSYQISELDGLLNLDETSINKKYSHFLPRATWRYNISSGKNLRFNYTTRVNQPSITQLSPVIDNSDPLRLYVGNPNLNAEYNHNLGLNFHSFTQFSSTSFFASASGSITEEKIITSRSVDDQLRETSTPINIDKETRLSAYTSYSRPFKPIHSRVSLNANFSLTNTQNQVDGQLLDVNRWSRTGGITFSNMNSEVLEYNLGGSWTLQSNLYTSDENLNQNTLLHQYFVDVTLTIWKKWQLSGSYEYNLYTSNQLEGDQALPFMEASLSRYILPADRGQIILSVFDVLDESRGITRTADINYIQEVRTNSIGRYVMLKFVYSLNGSSKEPPGTFRIMEHRR
jgi:hypothetical protein